MALHMDESGAKLRVFKKVTQLESTVIKTSPRAETRGGSKSALFSMRLLRAHAYSQMKEIRVVRKFPLADF